MWRKRLPHWRADGETYYLYSKFRRDLNEDERCRLFAEILRLDGNRAQFQVVSVLPDRLEVLVAMLEDVSGKSLDVGQMLEKAMGRAAKAIIKKSGERFSPFFDEPFDRIIRDDGERQEYVEQMLQRVEDAALADEQSNYSTFYMPENSASADSN